MCDAAKACGIGPRVAIVDYSLGNLFSKKRACEWAGIDAVITSDRKEILSADGVILPGVGAFGDAVENLRRLDLAEPIKDYIRSGKPLMGICLGMQLLFSESEEFGSFRGLDIIKGSVVHFGMLPSNIGGMKIPQVGWNRVFVPEGRDISFWKDTPLKSLDDGDYMYFVHSFCCVPSDGGAVLAETVYEGVRYASAVRMGNTYAFQFHPEKSFRKGLEVYREWARIVIRQKEMKR